MKFSDLLKRDKKIYKIKVYSRPDIEVDLSKNIGTAGSLMNDILKDKNLAGEFELRVEKILPVSEINEKFDKMFKNLGVCINKIYNVSSDKVKVDYVFEYLGDDEKEYYLAMKTFNAEVYNKSMRKQQKNRTPSYVKKLDLKDLETLERGGSLLSVHKLLAKDLSFTISGTLQLKLTKK